MKGLNEILKIDKKMPRPPAVFFVGRFFRKIGGEYVVYPMSETQLSGSNLYLSKLGQGSQDKGRRSPEVGQGSPEVGQRSPEMGQRSPEVPQRSPEVGQGSPEEGQRSPEVGQRSPEVLKGHRKWFGMTGSSSK